MRTRQTITLVLVAGLLGCDRSAPPPPKPRTPELQVSGAAVDLGGPVKAYRFSLDGSGCRLIHASLYHLSGDAVTEVTRLEFKSLPERVTGDLWLTEQTGEAFGKSAVLSYSLGETVKSPSTSATHGRFPVIEGVFPQLSEHVRTSGSVSSGREAVLFARCMSKQDNHSFGSGSLDQLKQHVRETKDIVVVVAVRWEPN